MSAEPSGSDDLKRARKGYDNYLRYTGLGFTMIGIVLLSTFAGWWLDQRVAWKFPVFTIFLSLLGIVGAMVYLFKEYGKR